MSRMRTQKRDARRELELPVREAFRQAFAHLAVEDLPPEEERERGEVLTQARRMVLDALK